LLDDDTEELWVFGYGSLMWRPGFDFIDCSRAWVHGYHRALCIYSHVHRGTPQSPGLVLGLDYGGSCQGVVFRIAPSKREKTIAYLRERELVTSVYLEKFVTLRLNDGSRKRAIAYVVDRQHNQYAGPLSITEMTQLILKGAGVNGDNSAYVRNTYEHLLRLNIHDAQLAEVVRHLDCNASVNTLSANMQKK
jgi:glutathione-specific gamma-glutamylcyclotransferase